MSYTRLTERVNKGQVKFILKDGENPIEKFQNALDRLAELEDKIEQGTLKEIPENAVVLTREEYDDMFTFKTTRGGFYNILDTVRKVERKDTAEKLLNKVDYESNGQTKAITDLLRKKYGVETK